MNKLELVCQEKESNIKHIILFSNKLKLTKLQSRQFYESHIHSHLNMTGEEVKIDKTQSRFRDNLAQIDDVYHVKVMLYL